MIDDIRGQFFKRLLVEADLIPSVPSMLSFRSEQFEEDSSVSYELNSSSFFTLCKCNVSGIQREARVTPNANSDIQRQGKKYGNLPNSELLENKFGYFSAG